MNRKILIADDDSEVLSSLCRLVRDYLENVEIQKVRGGQKLIEEAKRGGYDLIFTDNDMGADSIKGIEAVKQIREFDKQVEIYVISGDRISEQQLNESGATGLFNKSRDLQRIRPVLERLAK